jgi:hypothetical protein
MASKTRLEDSIFDISSNYCSGGRGRQKHGKQKRKSNHSLSQEKQNDPTQTLNLLISDFSQKVGEGLLCNGADTSHHRNDFKRNLGTKLSSRRSEGTRSKRRVAQDKNKPEKYSREGTRSKRRAAQDKNKPEKYSDIKVVEDFISGMVKCGRLEDVESSEDESSEDESEIYKVHRGTIKRLPMVIKKRCSDGY